MAVVVKTFSATGGTDVGSDRIAGATKDVAPKVVNAFAAMTGAHQTSVVNAVAALVADGATPTQAHVTTLNTAWTALLADITAAAASVLQGHDFVVMYDATAVATHSKLRSFMRDAADFFAGSGGLKP